MSAGLHRSTRPHVRLEYGTSGIAWSEIGHQRKFIARNPREPAMIGTRLVIERTVAAIQNGTVPPATAEDGRDGLEVIAACYHAARTGERVTLGNAARNSLETMPMATIA